MARKVNENNLFMNDIAGYTEFMYNLFLGTEPYSTRDNVEWVKAVSSYDLLVKFKNGKKILFDSYEFTKRLIVYGDELTDEEYKYEFATRLRREMKRNNATQEELAKAIGTSNVMISRYMTGKCIPSYITMCKLAKYLGCSLDDFSYKEF